MPGSIAVVTEVNCKSVPAYHQGTIPQDAICVICNHTWHVTSHCAYRMASVWKETQNLCFLWHFLGLKSLFHFRVWGALIITDKHKCPLTASSPTCNIALIFHLWLLTNSVITNKRSARVAIIAPSPSLDYLWHPSFNITVTGKRGSVSLGLCLMWHHISLCKKMIITSSVPMYACGLNASKIKHFINASLCSREESTHFRSIRDAISKNNMTWQVTPPRKGFWHQRALRALHLQYKVSQPNTPINKLDTYLNGSRANQLPVKIT